MSTVQNIFEADLTALVRDLKITKTDQFDKRSWLECKEEIRHTKSRFREQYWRLSIKNQRNQAIFEQWVDKGTDK